MERLLDSTSLLLRCVILGFTADGDHLVSYSFNDGRHELQVWAFRLHAPAVLVAAVPLFQNFSGDGDGDGGIGGGGIGGGSGSGRTEGMTERESEMLLGDLHAGDGHGDEMRISVCESADRDLLLIHGGVVPNSRSHTLWSIGPFIGPLVHSSVHSPPQSCTPPPKVSSVSKAPLTALMS